MRENDCPNESALQDFAEGRLSGQKEADVRGHIAWCEDCAQLFGALRAQVPEDAALGGTLNAQPAELTAEVGGPPSRGPPPADPGRIGAYRLVRRIGEGAMGTVYEAVNEQISRRCAIKIL